MGELFSHRVVTSVKMQQLDGNSKSRVGKGVAQQLKNGVRLLWGRIMQKKVDDGNSAGRVLDLDSQGCGVFDSQAIFS